MKNSGSTGRLNQTLHPIVKKIVSSEKENLSIINEFEEIALLNEAHLVNLHKVNLLKISNVKKILKTIANLRRTHFIELLQQSIERGTYLLFETYLNEKLSMSVAGSLHIGRSRNDINATLFKLRFRQFYKAIYNHICSVRSILLKQAYQYMKIAMPIYSQFQVSQVGTYGYYLLSIEEALSRDQSYLKELFFSLDECPIGAAAGCGTSFPIDNKFTAALLGFSRTCDNALDAVASRDFGLRFLCCLSIIGTTLSRVAQDFQLWTTQEFSFFDLPDNLCGSSSMMPQKKNPYLFEIIKGKSASLNGALIQALTAMHNVPFSNSVEVGTYAFHGINSTLQTVCDILTLLELLIGNAEPNEENFIKSINNGLAIATGVTECLVKEKNIPFRQAHHDVGMNIKNSLDNNVNPHQEILQLVKENMDAQPTIYWAHLNEYGGGPGKCINIKSYNHAKRRLRKDANWISKIENQWDSADQMLRLSIKNIIK